MDYSLDGFILFIYENMYFSLSECLYYLYIMLALGFLGRSCGFKNQE